MTFKNWNLSKILIQYSCNRRNYFIVNCEVPGNADKSLTWATYYKWCRLHNWTYYSCINHHNFSIITNIINYNINDYKKSNEYGNFREYTHTHKLSAFFVLNDSDWLETPVKQN